MNVRAYMVRLLLRLRVLNRPRQDSVQKVRIVDVAPDRVLPARLLQFQSVRGRHETQHLGQADGLFREWVCRSPG